MKEVIYEEWQKNPTREYKYLTSNFICCDCDYREENQDKEAHEDIRIREDDGEWRATCRGVNYV